MDSQRYECIHGERRADALGGAAVRTQGLTKRYGPVAALDHLDLEVRQGEVVGYLGPNGAGKTTTMATPIKLANTSNSFRFIPLSSRWTSALN